MARFEIDSTARPYVPGAPGKFWTRLADGCNWTGLLLLIAAVLAVPAVVIVLLLR